MEHPQHESNALEHPQKCAGTSTLEHPPKCAGTSMIITLEHPLQWNIHDMRWNIHKNALEHSQRWNIHNIRKMHWNIHDSYSGTFITMEHP